MMVKVFAMSNHGIGIKKHAVYMRCAIIASFFLTLKHADAWELSNVTEFLDRNGFESFSIPTLWRWFVKLLSGLRAYILRGRWQWGACNTAWNGLTWAVHARVISGTGYWAAVRNMGGLSLERYNVQVMGWLAWVLLK
jgi:hypothetical protein